VRRGASGSIRSPRRRITSERKPTESTVSSDSRQVSRRPDSIALTEVRSSHFPTCSSATTEILSQPRQPMTLALRIESNQHQRQSASREVSHKTRPSKVRAHTEASTPLRPSFASRIVQFVFRRGSDSPATETQHKSWSGPVATAGTTPASATLTRHASASILIPSPHCSSAASISRRSQPRDVLGRDSVADDDATCSDASWRQRQTHCVNCEQLFFTSMSALSNSAGRFCSLDCKTSFEYLNQLQQVLDGQAFLGMSRGSSSVGSWDSSARDQVEVEVYDSCCSGV
jgi:hypothetical protein